MKLTLFRLALSVVSTVMGLANTSSASIVTFVGSDLDVTAAAPGGGGYWRTAAVLKPNDIDGNNILGTDGFRYVTDNPGGNGANDIENQNASYATLSSLVGNNFRGNNDYAVIDDPTGGTTRSGTFNPTVAPDNAEGNLVSFGTIDFTQDAVVTTGGITSTTTARIGIMVDNLDNVIFNSHNLQLESGELNTGLVPLQAESGSDNRNPDWYYFDVTDFVTGDTVEIFATSSEGNPTQTTFPATIGAFALDSVTVVTTAVPEPSSATLFGFGAAALILRRRR